MNYRYNIHPALYIGGFAVLFSFIFDFLWDINRTSYRDRN